MNELLRWAAGRFSTFIEKEFENLLKLTGFINTGLPGRWLHMGNAKLACPSKSYLLWYPVKTVKCLYTKLAFVGLKLWSKKFIFKINQIWLGKVGKRHKACLRANLQTRQLNCRLSCLNKKLIGEFIRSWIEAIN